MSKVEWPDIDEDAQDILDNKQNDVLTLLIEIEAICKEHDLQSVKILGKWYGRRDWEDAAPTENSRYKWFSSSDFC